MVKEGHDGWQSFYAALDKLPERLKEPVPFVVQALPLLKDGGVRAVLDMGCGAGRHCIYLAKEGFEVVGIDTSGKALRMAEAWLDHEGIENATVLCASMTSLPFRDETFGAVISVSVMHHAMKGDIERAVEETEAVLLDGGVFLANLLSVEDYRYGSGREVESGTFLVSEDFEEGHFDEIHHFSTGEEIMEVLSLFRRIGVEPLQGDTRGQVHRYWKVTAWK